MKRKLSLIVAIMTLVMVFTSCSQAVTPDATTSATVSETTVETSDSTTETTKKELKPLDHDFNPHCLSEIYINKYGKEFEEDYYRYCDAILSGADTVKCSKKQWLPLFRDISRTYLPIANEYCYFFDEDIKAVGKDEYKLEYGLPQEEYLKKVEEFKARIEELIERACFEGDTPFEMTLALYKSEGLRISYDYDALGDNYSSPEGYGVSPYRTLMTDKGICQEIAGAYAYLLMQIGVDAITCSGLTKDSSTAHEWTLVKIDGKYYHCDLTFQLNETSTLRYFGMDDSQREKEGDWDMQYNNIGMTNDIWHKDLPIEDKRFELLWTCISYCVDREKHMLRCYDSYDCTGELIVEVPLS